MTKIGKIIALGAFMAPVALGAVAVTSPASAHVVCNRSGDCWSTHARYTYPRDVGARFYGDRYANGTYRDRSWRGMNRTWRDEHHENDRGYYRNGLWITF